MCPEVSMKELRVVRYTGIRRVHVLGSIHEGIESKYDQLHAGHQYQEVSMKELREQISERNKVPIYEVSMKELRRDILFMSWVFELSG